MKQKVIQIDIPFILKTNISSKKFNKGAVTIFRYGFCRYFEKLFLSYIRAKSDENCAFYSVKIFVFLALKSD